MEVAYFELSLDSDDLFIYIKSCNGFTMVNKYTMTISRNTIDKLGIRLYDKTSDVVSEIISNSYDADAENVTVTVPLDTFLATKKGQKITDKGFTITVIDNGHGMIPENIDKFYLTVGTDRRSDPKRKSWGAKSPKKHRPVMGRKGIGKLAGFGICKTIEVWSAGGKKDGSKFKIAHFIMNYDDMVQDTDEEYHPKLGSDDGKYSKTRGTKIILKNFLYRKIPDKDTFLRQVSRKFGLATTDFKIKIKDSISNNHFEVSELDLEIIDRTKIDLNDRPVTLDGKRLQVKGWVAYSKNPYRNEEMAGVRIYARKKLAAVTRDFGHKSGFTGEYTLRSYLVGVIHADWLDDDKDEDLIASDRQDILWASEKGNALKIWGQKLLEDLGKKSVGPINERAYEVFLEKSKLENEAKKRFGDSLVYQAALEVGKTLGSRTAIGNLQDEDYVKNLLELILAIAPHKMIVEKLRQIASEGNESAYELMASLFGDAKLAETASLGQIALERVNAIETLEKAARKRPPPPELELQKILENAPWLIEPQWTILQANESFEHMRGAFEKWYENKTRKKILTKVDRKNQSKRPDFIMLHVGRRIEIVEIKRPGHVFDNSEFDRLLRYLEKMKEFLDKNKGLAEDFPTLHVTLICDDVKLTGAQKTAYESLIKNGDLQHKTWEDTLSDTKHAHQDFIRARNSIMKSSSE
jgi:hypothetical protein